MNQAIQVVLMVTMLSVCGQAQARTEHSNVTHAKKIRQNPKTSEFTSYFTQLCSTSREAKEYPRDYGVCEKDNVLNSNVRNVERRRRKREIKGNMTLARKMQVMFPSGKL